MEILNPWWKPLEGGNHSWTPDDSQNTRHQIIGNDDGKELSRLEPIPNTASDCSVGVKLGTVCPGVARMDAASPQGQCAQS